MAKSLIQTAGIDSFSGGQAYCCLGSAKNQTNISTEVKQQTPIRTAGILSNFYININNTGTGTTVTAKVRKNGADGNQAISTTASQTGNFSDDTHTDSVVAGDLIDYSIFTATSNAWISSIQTIFSPTDTSVTLSKFNCSYDNGGLNLTSAATGYSPITGNPGSQGTESNMVLKSGVAGTWKNLSAYVASNTWNATTTIKNRKNAADGSLAVSIGSSTTGLFEDTTHSDSVSVTDTLDYSITLASGSGAFNLIFISSELLTTDGSFQHGSSWQGGSTMNYNDTAGEAALSGDSGTFYGWGSSYAKHSTQYTLLTILITANSLNAGSATHSLAVNGTASSLQTSIAYGTTGTFEDSTDNAVTGVTDGVGYLLSISGATSGSIVSYTRSVKAVFGTYLSMDGIIAGTYHIKTWADLYNMRNDVYGHYYLDNDLDSSTSDYNTYASSSANSGQGWINDENNFFGILDGQGYVIKDLYSNRTSGNNVGLFGVLSINSIVKNLSLVNFNITFLNSSIYALGPLAGYTHGATIENVYSWGSTIVGFNWTGGLIGESNCSSGLIKNCFADNDVTGCYYMGGFVGDNDDTIQDCFSLGSVTARNITVPGQSRTAAQIGGFCGNNYGFISNCYSHTPVTLHDVGDTIGGFLGEDNAGSVDKCYSTGHLYLLGGDTNVGGFCGKDDLGPGQITNSFWDTQTSGQVTSSNGGEVGKTTAQMQTLATFTGASWDMVNRSSYTNQTWFLLAGVDYPQLGFAYNAGMTISMDGILKGTNYATFTTDAILVSRVALTFTGDAITPTYYSDQTQLSIGSSFGFGQSGNGQVKYRGQKFTPTNSDELYAISFDRAKGSQGVKVYIDTVTGGVPTHNEAGALYSFTIPNSSVIDGSGVYFLPIPLPLTGGTQYCFYLAPWDTTTDTYADDYQDVHGINVAGSNEITYTVGSGWSQENLAFHYATLMLAPGSKSFTADGIMLAHQTAPFTVDGDIFATNKAPITADGIIFAVNNVTFTVDGEIEVTGNLKTFTIDALLVATSPIYGNFYGFWLANTLLKTPIGFKKDYVYRRTDTLVMSGKSVRDFTGLKQKFTLTFKNLNPDQVLDITKIMDQKTKVSFSVNLRDEVIINTIVWPYLGNITYQTLGSSYLADASIELVEATAS